MTRRLQQASFGLAAGVAARFMLPGHYPISLLLTAILSLAGALGVGFLAEQVLPSDALKPAGLVISALGALAMLLAYGVAVQ